jgi:hypothetical protein
MFVDHPSWFDDYPSLRNLAGIVTDALWDPHAQAINGTITLYTTDAGQVIADLFDEILSDSAAGRPAPDVGLSAVLWCKWQPDDDSQRWQMSAIQHVESVDFVFEPGADGRVNAALAALASLGPDPAVASGIDRPDPRIETLGAPSASLALPHHDERTQPMPEQLNTQPETPADVPAWVSALRAATADAMIAASGLPAAAQARLRGQQFAAPANVEAAISAERDYLATLVADQVVQVGGTPPRGAAITLGRTGLEQLQAALEALVTGTRPPAGVQPLTGLRELYHLLSGDYDMHGVFQPDRIHLANVTSSTMAGLVANALNKAVVNRYMDYPHWWEPAVTPVDFSTLQDARWTTLGGVGELPTVAEGAAYTELTWDDQTETDSFTKKGGYLGITLEAIDKDDTSRLQAAPRALAQAAWLTLGKAISAIFTDNSGVGPTMSDTGALFNATAVSTTGGHANLLTTALSWTAWEAVKVAMMKQPELNSGERLGALTRPRFLWVPIDLETTALQILASEGEPGTGDNDINPFADGNEHDALLANARRRVIVCPLWTDTNNWAAQADPNLYPSIGLGFRYGRTPEIFSVASPTAGLMFTNDTLPVKVRFFFAVGPTDWRGLHKNNVA